VIPQAERPGPLHVRVGCEFRYAPSLETAAVFVVRPGAGGQYAVVSESWKTEPALAWHDYRDVYGNECRRVTMSPGPFTLRYDALVETTPALDPIVPDAIAHPASALPDDTLMYTLPSRFCLSDALAPVALEQFGNCEPGWATVQAICDFVHDHLVFGYGWSGPMTTAVDAYENRRGVCRDFAHLAITFCRAMNIPARYAFGYLPDIDIPPPYSEMDFCAWFEAYLGDRWYTFDPRNNQRRRGRILLARGRDALDVAMVTTFGNPNFQSMLVWADPEPQPAPVSS
jgi:transglutaminase-like putative cysteine protease